MTCSFQLAAWIIHGLLAEGCGKPTSQRYALLCPHALVVYRDAEFRTSPSRGWREHSFRALAIKRLHKQVDLFQPIEQGAAVRVLPHRIAPGSAEAFEHGSVKHKLLEWGR